MKLYLVTLFMVFIFKRSTHSALKIIKLQGMNISWVIQGDISKCFDSIPHNIFYKEIMKNYRLSQYEIFNR